MKSLSLNAAYEFGIAHGLEKEIKAIRELVVESDYTQPSRLRRGMIVELFENHNIFEQFKAEHWPLGNTLEGQRKRQRYLNVKGRYDDFLAGRIDEEDAEQQAESEEEQRFAAESDLRDFLADNLECIEGRLRLYRKGDRDGVEFPIDAGFIDLLAVDEQGRYVVIELKVGKGRNKAIGQLLYYMAWVDKHLGNGPCRGMVIAKEIPPDLQLAVERAPGISLYKYNLEVSVEAVKK
jgi:Endonuclease NucS